MTQRNQVYRDLDTHTIVVRRIHFIIGFGIFMGFVHNNNIECHQVQVYLLSATAITNIATGNTCLCFQV